MQYGVLFLKLALNEKIRSIPHEIIDKINAELESDIMVRAIHDVKGIDMGNNLVRYKAEVDFDSRELAQCYLDKQDLDGLLTEVKKFEKIDELEIFLLRHGERIVDTLGLEIDRIESKLKVVIFKFLKSIFFYKTRYKFLVTCN